MEKIYILVTVIIVVGALAFPGCKSKQQIVQLQPYQTQLNSEYTREEFVEPPCVKYDNDTVFAGFSSAYGPASQEAAIRLVALTNAQNIVRQKMQHAYDGIVSDYFNFIGENNTNTAKSNIESVGDQIIDVIVNDTQEKCIRRSKTTDDKGNITYYIGIEINKKEAANKIADELSKDGELDVRFYEYNYREHMEKKFKDYKED